MRIRWSAAAAGDLEEIFGYLARELPHYRQSTMRRIYERIRSLKTFPTRGRPGRVPGSRELLLLPLAYIVVYRVTDDRIEILRIRHAAQKPN